jgi:hypothetical protein
MSGVTNGRAFWVKNGTIYEVERTHIRFVLDNPELFNRKKEELVSVFATYGEKIGFEGKAREEIIRSLVGEGWIRIRHYIRPKDYWSIHCTPEADMQDEIEPILAELHSRGYITAYDTITINGAEYKL